MRHLNRTIQAIPPIDKGAVETVQRRLDNLTKPQGSLGRLEELAKRVAGMTGKARPGIGRKIVIIGAGDHGVAKRGVSAYPQEVTCQMVRNFIGGGAAINVLARHVGAEVLVIDFGVAKDLSDISSPRFMSHKIGYGTGDISSGPAMSREQAVAAVEAGIKVAEQQAERGVSFVVVGDMGIGNTTSSSAVVAALTGASPEEVTGRGTGIDDKRLAVKIEAVRKALQVNSPTPDDPLDVLAKVGGFEIGGLAGVILGCAARRIPVVLDGFITGAAALIAAAFAHDARNYMIASHCSAEPGHKVVLEALNLTQLFNLNMRLGEGTGGVVALSLVEAALKILNEMSTFEEAGVSRKVD